MPKKVLILTLCFLNCVCSWAQSKADSFQQVFSVIAAPNIHAHTWDELLEKLKPWCEASTRSQREQYKHGNVECRDVVQAASIKVLSGGQRRISLIDASFHGLSKCSYMKKTLIANFGKPTTIKADCNVEWRLPTPKGEPQRFVGIESSLPDNKVYFSIGEEQGP